MITFLLGSGGGKETYSEDSLIVKEKEYLSLTRNSYSYLGFEAEAEAVFILESRTFSFMVLNFEARFQGSILRSPKAEDRSSG